MANVREPHFLVAEEKYKAALRAERVAWDSLLSDTHALPQGLGSLRAATEEANLARNLFLESQPVPLQREPSESELKAIIKHRREVLGDAIQVQKAAWARLERKTKSTGTPDADLHRAWLEAVRSVNFARADLRETHQP